MPALHIADACRVLCTCLTPTRSLAVGRGAALLFPSVCHAGLAVKGGAQGLRLRPVAVCDPVTAGAAA